jgi:polygalacturonase
MKFLPTLFLPSLLLLGASGMVHAQDTRKVTEPVLPPACAVLTGDVYAAERNDGIRIQAAIDACAPGHAVVLAASNGKRSFVSGPLVLKSGVTLVVDDGATLYASSDPRLFERGGSGVDGKPGACGTNDQNGRGCRPLIAAENTRGSGIMGRGAIDGRGGEKMLGAAESWWQIARRAQKEKTRQNVPRLIQVDRSQDFTLYGILLKNSPNFHVTLNGVDGFTAWGVKIDTPHDARNTDGIDPISSRNITIAHSWIRTGDDNIAIKGGNNGLTENVSVLHNHFYSGHGMSIGSETNGGVRRVLVDDLSMDGTTSGLRIKSNDTRGGIVSDILYHDICLRGTRAPIDIYTHYEQSDTPGALIPDYRDVRMEGVHSVTPGKVNLQGYDTAHPLQLRLQDVVIAGKPDVKTEFARVSGSASFLGDGSNAGASAIDCGGRFPAFPAEPLENARPQLTAAQAGAYELHEVLKYVGPLGAERVDPWDPLADPLATGAPFTPDYTVDASATPDGVTRFASVQAAVNKALGDTRRKRRAFIRIQPGVYRELLYVPASGAPVTLYGDGPDPRAVRIVAGLDASTTGADYRTQYGAEFTDAPAPVRAMFDQLKDLPALQTTGSGTAWVRGDGFQARNLTIENGYNRDGARAHAECAGDRCPDNTGGSRVHHQAVALRVDGADRVQFENVRLLGLQDTLFLNSRDGSTTARSFFNRSHVEGDVDFIFGDTIAYFQDCEIKSIGGRAASYALAPDTSRRARYGFVFNRCRFTADQAAGAGAGATEFYFARQWFHNQRCTPYGWMAVDGYRCRLGDVDVYRAPEGTIRLRTLESVGKAVIMNSRIGAHIDRAHPWSEWNRNGSMAHRPAQFSSDDYWANLEHVHPAVGLDTSAVLGKALGQKTARPAPAEIYLGEYNNTNE